jgi:hypothetical protein
MSGFLRGGRGRRVARSLGRLWACVLSTVFRWRGSGADDLRYRGGTRPPDSGNLEPLDDGLGWSHREYLWVGVHDDGYGLGIGPGELGAVENEVELALRVIVEVGMHGRVALPT